MRGSFRSRPLRAAVGCAALLAVAAVAVRIWRRAPAAPHSRPASARALPVPTPRPALLRWDNGPGYDSIAYDADPAAIAAGRVAGLAVVDSVALADRSLALLVRAGPAGDQFHEPTHHVILASDSGPVRTFRRTGLVGIGRLPKGLGFGAMDVDGDGVREPYVATWSGGTGGYEVEVQVLNRRGRDDVEYDLEGAWDDLGRRGSFAVSSPRPASRARRRLDAIARRIADVADPGAYNPEVLREQGELHEWKRRYGAGYHDGPVRVSWHPGKVPFQAWACSVPDGEVAWIVHGALWEYDAVRNRHRMVDGPVDGYSNGARGLVAGRRYVWMEKTVPVGSGYGLLAYDKQRGRLLTVAVPELRATDHTCDAVVCAGPSLSVRGGRLRADSTLLTLPPAVDPRRELADAKSCGG